MNEGSCICLHYQGGCSLTCAKYAPLEWSSSAPGARSRAKAVERDLLVAYPVMDPCGPDDTHQGDPLA